MKLTRPQRRSLYGAVVFGGWFILAFSAWSATRISWHHAPPGGTHTLRLGMLEYVTITTRHVDPTGASALPDGSISRTWRWHRGRLATLLLATVFTFMLASLLYRDLVRRGRLSERCDECGYPLAGLAAERCPECGAPVDARGRPAGG